MTTLENKSGSPEVDAIRHHYEISNDVYRILLGEPMMYSGGYWYEGEDLREAHDEAQYRKLDKFIDDAKAAGADKVLDIGSGWGTMLDRVTRVHGAKKAVGVTLSRTQKEWVDAKGNSDVEIIVESWADHTADEPYDAAFCVNALEHFVLSSLPSKERINEYRKFFQKVQGLLKVDGRFVLHMMTIEPLVPQRKLIDDIKFLQREEFKGCYIPPTHELIQAIGNKFEIVEIKNERESFSQACRAWLLNLADERERAVSLSSEEVCQRFERYLDIFAYTLEDKIFNNFRIVLSRNP
ncbi:cyclopropane-fatty-acyl-phospholipid synthase [Kibdelosporangium banguiense]|uniref:Cyclopropane-fatty-acyl-phospholipid synthase n=1 Tax=Kibdelosporangium banguiense TaxID=1365924 RepID=A0ABS4TNN4_9PSEU|nr:class I SAM-dependent methyltransferase [Kibdelosporangium banguiense]MBP2326016.1 cyclopropane-fatty-acyl-phospholipid synthase [Kibdelosporangium banguiense]